MRSDHGMVIRRAAAAVLMLLVAFLLQPGDGYAAERRTSAPAEYQVKAAFVYNFIKFVEWPLRGRGGNAAEDTVRFCVLGDLPDKAPFEALDGQEIMGKRLYLVFLREPEESTACHILFLPSTVSNRLSEVLEGLQGQPTLTIGDTEGYARRGVMINMYLDNKRVRFEINARTADAAGLRISAKLLNLAGAVYGISRTGN
jgi:hypothetical protein